MRKHQFNISTDGYFTRIADIAATMAGVPKPWLIMEKCVKCLWMPGSSRGWGRVLHSGLRSWFRKSTSSLQINLREDKQHEASKHTICHQLCSEKEILPAIHVRVLPGEVLRHGPRGELGLTDVAKVPGEMNSLALHQRGQEGHVTSLSPPGRQREAETVQLVSELLTSVLRFSSAYNFRSELHQID